MFTEEIETSRGKILLRGLKHGEKKNLLERGIDLSKDITDEEDADKKVLTRVAEVLKYILSDEFKDIDEFYDGEVAKIYRKIMNLTYPTEEQEKNSG